MPLYYNGQVSRKDFIKAVQIHYNRQFGRIRWAAEVSSLLFY